ncbi:uncharacterized protein [Nicotiana sylvestris]|uniref:uncharacterized protein n=1 Tax=Nicotiana sylvestris TaxID=4096 RepID=UPI00388CCDA1
MRTRGRNRLVIEQDDDEDVRPYIENLMDGQNHSSTQPYIEQLMDNQNTSEDQARDDQSCNLNSSAGGTEVQQNDDESQPIAHHHVLHKTPMTVLELQKQRFNHISFWHLMTFESSILGNLELRKVVDVPFNNRNQVIGEKGRKLAIFLGIIARTPELTHLHVDDWRKFDEEKKKLVDFKKFSIPRRGEAYVLKSLGKKWKDYKYELQGEYLRKYKTKDLLLKNRPSRIPRDQWSGLVAYWLSDKAKRRSQANRNNRANQKMPHTGGSKSIATLTDEQVPVANSGHERVPQTSRIPNVAENIQCIMVIQSEVRLEDFNMTKSFRDYLKIVIR